MIDPQKSCKAHRPPLRWPRWSPDTPVAAPLRFVARSHKESWLDRDRPESRKLNEQALLRARPVLYTQIPPGKWRPKCATRRVATVDDSRGFQPTDKRPYPCVASATAQAGKPSSIKEIARINFDAAAEQHDRSLRDEFPRYACPWVETHGYHQRSLRDDRRSGLFFVAKVLDNDDDAPIG